MNGFYKMQEALRAEGWFVEWNMPCCQSCAWGEVEHDDLSKVLFNHSQDCEVYVEGEECTECLGECEIENPDFDEDVEDSEEYIDCPECFGMGEIQEGFDASEYDTSVSGFVCNSPEDQSSSYFCFDGGKEGVANFKEIIPIIEECGVTIDSFDESGKTRIELSW
jgi:hypothetical protein